MTLQIGVIGCGAIAECHLRAIRSQSSCRIAACCDVDLGIAKQRANQFGVPHVFANASDLLALPELDVVAICTPPRWHCELALSALRRGLHVVLEKPLALNLAEADEILAATNRDDRIVGVALVHRYLPVYSAVRKLIQSGVLGKLQQTQLMLGRNMYGDSRFISPSLCRRGWLVDPRIAGGGMMMSSSVHFFSVNSYILGNSRARTVTGRVCATHPNSHAGIEDYADLQIEWDNGVTYHHRESWTSDIPYHATIRGELGELEVIGEDFLRLSLRGRFEHDLSPEQQELIERSGPSGSSIDETEQLIFNNLWADMVGVVTDGRRRATFPEIGHARDMQAIVSAAYKAGATDQSCDVDGPGERLGSA